jgi:hypothetical protein
MSARTDEVIREATGLLALRARVVPSRSSGVCKPSPAQAHDAEDE